MKVLCYPEITLKTYQIENVIFTYKNHTFSMIHSGKFHIFSMIHSGKTHTFSMIREEETNSFCTETESETAVLFSPLFPWEERKPQRASLHEDRKKMHFFCKNQRCFIRFLFKIITFAASFMTN